MLELETAIASLEKRWDAGMKRATAHGFSDAVAEAGSVTVNAAEVVLQG